MRFFLFAGILPVSLALVHGKYQAGGLAPAPTPGPTEFELRRALYPRDGGTTCGWASGNQDQPYTCGAGLSCVYNTGYSAFGCCSGDWNACSLQTNCYGSGYASLVTSDAHTRVCNNPDAPICQTYIMPNAYVSFGCGTTNTQFWLRTTYAGGAVTAGGYYFGPQGTRTSLFAAAPTAAKTTGPDSGGVGSAAPGGGSGGAQSSGSGGSSITNSNSNENSVNVGGPGSLSTGAIAGIAVAGALLAIGAGVGLFLCYRRNNHQHPPQQPYYPPNQPNYNQGPPGHGPATYTNKGSTFSSPTSPSVAPSKYPMTESNMDTHLGAHQKTGEWDFAGSQVSQQQTAGRTNADGIRGTEIMPSDAVDERLQREEARMRAQAAQSEVAPTALAPTMLSHNVQNV